MNEKWIITGPFGHIGSHLLDHLKLPRQVKLVLVDSFLTQRYPLLFTLKKNNRELIHADIREVNWNKLLTGADLAIHLAAITDAPHTVSIPQETFDVNFNATVSLAEACAKKNVRLIFPSTTSVYGTQKTLIDEACAPEELKPQSPYAESKYAAEQYLQKLSRKKLRVFIGRLGTIYGFSPGMRFHTAVNKFIWQAAFHQPLTVWKTALHQKRPYLGLQDLSRALDFVVAKNIFDGGIYNLVTHNYTVAEILAAIRVYIPKFKIAYVDSAIMNQLSYEVSTEKFSRLGFKFNDSLRSSVAKTVQKVLQR